jgi:methionyl-tRNA formyltransferase
MNIVIITTDEPFYLPITIQKLLETSVRGDIKRIILLPPTAKKRRWKTIIAEQMRFGIIYFIYRSFQYLSFKLLSKRNLRFKGKYYSIEAVANVYKVPLSRIYNINSEDAIVAISKDNPDLIVSLSASQIFSKKVIDLAQWAAINVHNAPLPKYQGLMPSFWVLLNGEKETATTVHLLDEKIDTGDIVLQKKTSISDDETLDSLIKKTKLLTVGTLLETFELFKKYEGVPPTIPNKIEEATYFGFPTKADIKKFRQSGRKILWNGIY